MCFIFGSILGDFNVSGFDYMVIGYSYYKVYIWWNVCWIWDIRIIWLLIFVW